MARYANILETIGDTPLVRLNKLAPPGLNVWVKVESFNPMGSVKDRMALEMIEAAFKMGADGIAFQIFRAAELVVRRHPERKDLDRTHPTALRWLAARADKADGVDAPRRHLCAMMEVLNTI